MMPDPCLSKRMLRHSLLASVVAVLASHAWGTSGQVRPAPHWGTTSTPLPPPPAWATPQFLSRFYTLFLAFSHLPPLGKPSFSQWLDMNGVTSPHVKAQMLALYAWYTGQMQGGAGGW